MFKDYKIPDNVKNTLVVLGNGFDIDLGVNTRWKDFVDSGLFKEIYNTSKGTKTFSKFNLFDVLYTKFENNDKRWIDIEESLREFALDADIVSIIDSGDDIRHLKFQFDLLRRAITIYLKDIDYSRINPNSSALKLLKAIRHNYKCLIYTFNYTDLYNLNKYIGTNSPSYKVTYVHGTLADESIVVGFDQCRLPCVDLDFMIKYQSDTYKNNKPEFDKDLKAADEVIIFGHTLGSTDHSYFQDFLLREGNRDETRHTPITIITANADSKRQINREIYDMTDGQVNPLNVNFFYTHDRNLTPIDDYFEDLRKRNSPNFYPQGKVKCIPLQ